MPTRFEIRLDDLSGEAIRDLLREHSTEMQRISPPESMHALDLPALRGSDVTFWSAWRQEILLGGGALKTIDARHGEIKSMRTTVESRRTGVGRALLDHIVAAALARGMRRLSLETGSQPEFEPARRLYATNGFEVCGPFADYQPDPNSVFMTREL